MQIKNQVSNARNLDQDRERVGSFKVVAFKDGEFSTPIDVRVWMGRSRNATKVYASVWVHAPDVQTSGYGYAGGYGYCRTSAAIAAAFASAGIECDDFSGQGEGAVHNRLAELADHLGYDTYTIVS